MSSNTKASVFWKLPRHSSEVLSVGYKEWDKDSLLHTNPDDYGVGYESRDLQKLYNNEFEARVLSTCGHSIHYDCLASRTIGISQYPCPLCHNLNESFLPSYVGSLDLEVLERCFWCAKAFKVQPNCARFRMYLKEIRLVASFC